MEVNNEAPFEIVDVEPKLTEELETYFTGTSCRSGFVKVGPKGYFFPSQYRQDWPNFYNLEVRPSDVFVVTYPRSGTTWVQEMVWLIANDLDFDTAKKIHLNRRYNFLEFPTFDKDLVQFENDGGPPKQLDIPSPRFIKSHLAFSLLTPSLLQSKVVYVIRDPRDVAVSYFRHNRLITLHRFVGDFRRFWRYFVKGLVNYGPYFDHVKEAWAMRHHPNMLVLYYEDMCKDLPSSLRQIASFFNKELTEDQVQVLSEHLAFSNFTKNASTNVELMEKLGKTVAGEQPFFFKGQSGGWKSYFDEDMTQEAQKWMDENLQGSDIQFSGLQS